MRVFFWFLPTLGSIVGALVLLVTFGAAGGAPQVAAGAAVAVAIAVIPYVLARSSDELYRQNTRDPG